MLSLWVELGNSPLRITEQIEEEYLIRRRRNSPVEVVGLGKENRRFEPGDRNQVPSPTSSAVKGKNRNGTGSNTGTRLRMILRKHVNSSYIWTMSGAPHRT